MKLALAWVTLALAALVMSAPAGQESSSDRAAGEGRALGSHPRPYADSSPFNQRLPDSPRLHPDSEAIVDRLLGFGSIQDIEAGVADTPADWSAPVYAPTDEDPVFTVHCRRPWGTCEVEGARVRIPDAARPAAGGDGHLVVVDRKSGWEYDFWQVRSKPRGGGRLEVSWGGRTRLDGEGLDSPSTAAAFGRLGGIIQAEELRAERIDHALYMVAYCDSGDHVYPAGKSGRSCSSIGLEDTNAPPMGTRFALDMSEEQIAALEVPGWKQAILRAMAEYGLFLGDTGSGSWALQAESGASYTSFGEPDPLVAFAQEQGVPRYDGRYLFNLRDGVDWERHLRVIDPCVTAGSC